MNSLVLTDLNSNEATLAQQILDIENEHSALVFLHGGKSPRQHASNISFWFSLIK